MKTYYMLTKPGIIMGNVITTAAGFALASKGNFDYWLFSVTMLGLAFVIASAGVFNNYIDRKMDAKMERTKNRPLVIGTISVIKALGFATFLLLIGIALLAIYTNLLTVMVALSGFFIYLVLYAFLKYHSFYGTLVGSLAGGIPPVVGYCAVSNQLDTGAFILFMILVLWQMPHFFSIAIYRFDDYSAASIPVLPVQKGMHATKIQMVLYIIAFTATATTLTLSGYTGTLFFATALTLGLAWLFLCLYGFKEESNPAEKEAVFKHDVVWARNMFRFSLVVIMGLCLSITLDVN